MKAIISKTISFLLTPFREHLLFLISFFILATSPFILKYRGNLIFAIFIAFHCITLSYLVTLIVSAIPTKIIRKLLQVILIGISTIMFALNIYCLFTLNGLVDTDYIMLVLNTNHQEAKEFASLMIPRGILIGVTATYLFLLLLWGISNRCSWSPSTKFLATISTLVFFCIAGNIYSWEIWQDGPIKHLSILYEGLSMYEMPNDSQLNHVLPEVVSDDQEKKPNNVVLIIGESFARYHSSLYGYDVLTNPYLGRLKDDSLLFTFDSINAAAPTTLLSLKYSLSTYNKSDEENEHASKKWFEYLTIIDLMKACGFDCYWYSNQAKTGQFNYIARAFAETCDYDQFFQQEGPTDNNQIVDFILVDSTANTVKMLNQSKHHFIIYHMMGSHFEYRKRYPAEFEKFNEKDYTSHPQHQREIIASYDNSILYNDYVVSQIINLFSDNETIVIYMPDHGQDMYRSSPNYHTHGKPNDSVSYAYGVEIPFIIYASPLFQKRHPNTIKRIKNRQEHPKTWNCDDLPYFIMDIIGVKTVNGEDIQSKSVLN